MKVPIKFATAQTPNVSASWRLVVLVAAFALVLGASPQQLRAFQDQQQPASDSSQAASGQDQSQGQSQSQAPAYTPQTADQLDQLVAPIALYPDSLVAQVLAGSTFPAQVVEADRWVQANTNLTGDALAQAVDQQSWDPSIKALTAFPSVLANMDKNLSWTSSLGDAYYNQQSDVMNAIQVMRQKAQSSGNLQTTTQQTVQTQGSTIVIQPADPQVVYVPAYNPWVVYGPPVVAWPGWYAYPGIWYGGPSVFWGGFGFHVGFYAGYGWGWHNWGTNWNSHVVVYNHNTYYSHTNTFYNRNNYYRNGGYHGVTNNVNHPTYNRPGENGGGEQHNTGDHGGVRPGENGGGEQHNAGDRGGVRPGENGGGEQHIDNGSHGVYNRPGATTQPFSGNRDEARGYGDARAQRDEHSTAFSGYNHGGEARSYSDRGRQSFGGGGGGGGFRGGGGGGGGRGGGGRR